MRATAQAQLDNVMDCMSGADGGVGFIALRALLDGQDHQDSEGDEGAAQVLLVLSRFSKLIDFAREQMLS